MRDIKADGSSLLSSRKLCFPSCAANPVSGLMLMLAFGIGDDMIFPVHSRTRNAAKIRTGGHVDYVITADSRATLKSRQLRNYGERKRARRTRARRNEKKTWNLLNAEWNSEPRPRWPSEGDLNEVGHAPNLNLHRRYL